MSLRKNNRAMSSGNIMDYERSSLDIRKSAPDRPVHKPTASFLSMESGFTNLRGIFNWGLLLLMVFGGKMALKNLIRNGIIVDPFVWRYIVTGEHAQPAGIAFILCSNIFILVGYTIELSVIRWAIPQCALMSMVLTNLFACIFFPTVIVLMNDWSPFFTSPVLSMYIVIFLKLWSYAMVNNWCRHPLLPHERKSAYCSTGIQSAHTSQRNILTHVKSLRELSSVCNKKKPNSPHNQNQMDNLVTELPDVCLSGSQERARKMSDEISFTLIRNMKSYPENVTLADMYYFMFAPTLCYELNFPRTFAIRKKFLLRHLMELICLVQVINCLIQQWMVPALKSSVTPFIRSRWTYTLERLLNIAIPNNVIWLLFFYATFHSFLNVVAELMRFGDRYFYADWWNATSVSEFWSTWNIPVHRWCHRHIYTPLLSRGFSRCSASTLVFFTSAFFHELIVSVPLKMFRCWVFLSMLGQQPYAYLLRRYFPKGGNLNNATMWFSVILGQPLVLYAYFHDYYIQRCQ